MLSPHALDLLLLALTDPNTRRRVMGRLRPRLVGRPHPQRRMRRMPWLVVRPSPSRPGGTTG